MIEFTKEEVIVLAAAVADLRGQLTIAVTAYDYAMEGNLMGEMRAKGIEVGSKVRIGSRIGIFTGVKAEHARARPIVAKMNKDGRAHAISQIWVWDDAIVEPFNE
jgi:hypothetical protein